MTPQSAVRLGQLVINLPVVVIMLGVFAGEGFVLDAIKLTYNPSLPMALFLILMMGLVAMAPAWLYWSYAVPRWKLWAYSRVPDVKALKIAAIKASLIWPDGHPLEKTEICSKAMRQQILKFEGRLS
ncbi:hypothetical protein [Asticcacaulis sp. EMRT-3]|uniref:hypothetical protein n=1 Tax=Asticcacaulis sp. EMRT-3 TaxID=3040349 RepID=UPI0024AFF898|nr:hypothetical protein [Asticcacaulis sp. EMRT-3]MDI7776180.1 hypothetical protein [Asticcacaulis sp. EMRT-3]